MINKYVAVINPAFKDDKAFVESIDFVSIDGEAFESVNTIDEFVDELSENGKNNSVYLHKLNIGGNFILNWLINSDYKEAVDKNGDLVRSHAIKDGEYTYTVSEKGEWFSLSLKKNKSLITFHDSYKIIPFSISDISKSFNIHYDSEVLILRDAIREMISRGYTKTTIGNCCMEEYKKWCVFDKEEWKRWFPDLTKVECPVNGFNNTDEYIRKAYHGGWCYLKDGKSNKIINGGITADVNGLYSAMMHSNSGNVYPVGLPRWFEGSIPSFLIDSNRYYYFVRIKTRFNLKRGYLPTVKVKDSSFYDENEWLKTSDYEGKRFVTDIDGNIVPTTATMVLTMTDYELLQKHYNLSDTVILDGCYFRADGNGLFDLYINKFARMKAESTNPVDRTIAKLMLNNLSGKFAASSNSNYKMFTRQNGKGIVTETIKEHNKAVGYIAIGAAITSYARAYTITAAQSNYDSFIYSDTDSIHCACEPSEVKGIEIDSVKLGCWKIESTWDEAKFLRQKCYVEHVTHENLNAVKPYYNIKCAGLTEGAKEYIANNLLENFDIKQFKPGLKIPYNAKYISVEGGVAELEVYYEIK